MLQTIRSVLRVTLCALCIFALPEFASAQQTAHVAYLEGQILLQTPLVERVPLQIGDELPSKGVLILSDTALLELDLPTGRILLTQPGSYELERIMGRSTATPSRELGAMVGTRLRSMSFDSPSSRGSVAAGVRGTEAESSDTALPWAAGELADELVAEAVAYLESGLYLTARETLEDATSLGAEGPELTFLLGYLSYLSEDLPGAYRRLSTMALDPDTIYYETHALVLAQLYYDGFAFSDASAVLQPVVERQLNASDELEFEPLALLVLSLYAAGRPEEARSYITRIEESSLPQGREYAEQLRNLDRQALEL
ncbi:MAG: hypothetical protein EA428_09070 [Spirochaetaceae bacterium]|nr:MAG: hypothetical protein EA428_09070 [Spirochaetaceae bacterium]